MNPTYWVKGLKGFILVALGLTTGCPGTGGSGSSAPLTSYAAEREYDGSNSNVIYDTSTCNDAAGMDTPLVKFSERFQDNTQRSNVVPRWPKGQNIALSVIAEPATQAARDAINTWNTDLQNRAPGQLQLSVTVSNSALNNSGVIGFGPTYGGDVADAGGGTQMQLSSDGNTYTNATINIADNGTNGMDSYTYWYNTSLHEIGHALGLAHNPYYQSVMYFADRSPSTYKTCYTRGRHPLYQDTNPIEAYYDPIYVAPNPKPCTSPACRCSAGYAKSVSGGWVQPSMVNPNPCPLVRTPTSVAIDADRASQRRSSVGGYARTTYALSQSVPPNGRWIHHPERNAPYEVSSESLVLASSLVAQVTVEPSISHFIRGGQRYVVTPLVVHHVLKKAFGPDQTRKPLDRLYVVEPIPIDETDYVDEPRLRAGTMPIVFLRREARARYPLSGAAAYTFTYPFVSKWHVAADGHLSVMGLLTTRAAREVDALTGPALMKQAIRRYGLLALTSEEALVRAMLARRGARAGNQVGRYAARLSLEPSALADEARAFDQVNIDPIDY